MDSKVKIVLAVVAALVVFGALGFFLFSGGGEENGNGDSVDSAGQQAVSEGYVAWNEGAFEASSTQQRWLYFHADWCPDCRALDADINANLSDIPDGVALFKVDFDDNQDLRQEYGVPRQTTIVAVDSAGVKTNEILATGSNRSLDSVIEALYVEPTVEDEDEDKGDESNQGQDSDGSGSAADDSQVNQSGSDGTTPSGSYTEWSEANFEAAADEQRWLYFHADWCSVCRVLNDDINANLSDIPDDVVIFKVDFDDNQDLRQKYGVTTQTVIVAVDAQGEKTQSYNAYSTPDLISIVEALE